MPSKSILFAVLFTWTTSSFSCPLSGLEIDAEEINKFNQYASELAFAQGATDKSEQSKTEKNNIKRIELWQFLHVVCGNKALATLPYTLAGKYDHSEKFKPLIEYIRLHPNARVSWQTYSFTSRSSGGEGQVLVIYRNDRNEIRRAANYLISMKRDPSYTYATPPEIFMEGLIYGYSESLILSYIGRIFQQMTKDQIELMQEQAQQDLAHTILESRVLESEPDFFKSGYKKFLTHGEMDEL